MYRILLIGCLFALTVISTAVADDKLSADKLKDLLKNGGKHWSNSEEGTFGFQKYEKPGKLLFIWPSEDRIYPVTVSENGSGTVQLELNWSLQPGEEFQRQFPEYVTYIWGEPGGKAKGFQVTNRIDPKVTSGKFSINLEFSKQMLEELHGEHEQIVLLVSNGPLSNFLRVKIEFPK